VGWSQRGLGDWERVCQAGRVKSLDGDRQRQALKQERSFSIGGPRHLGQTPSDLC